MLQFSEGIPQLQLNQMTSQTHPGTPFLSLGHCHVFVKWPPCPDVVRKGIVWGLPTLNLRKTQHRDTGGHTLAYQCQARGSSRGCNAQPNLSGHCRFPLKRMVEAMGVLRHVRTALLVLGAFILII